MQAVAREHGRDITAELIPGVGHDVRLKSGGPYHERYWDLLEAWLCARRFATVCD